jgi:Tol biopolymer transport system component/DNA-binding winged helix-turn-helix (wHTH) protein
MFELEPPTNGVTVRANNQVFHMDQANGSARVLRFGVFQADLQTGELHKHGVKVPLQGQPFQVCAILLSRAGELVSREELRQKVWPEDTFVDFDQALNTSITKIRAALGDDADNPRFVETLPRRGYRFIAAVEGPNPNSSSFAAITQQSRVSKFATQGTLIAVGIAFLGLLSAFTIPKFFRNRALPPAIEVLPLAGLSGIESQPAFSLDGNHVAFVLHSKNASGIFTTMVGGEKSFQLTQNSGDCCPTWSPDGRQIAFSRMSDGGADIYIVPATGGTEHRLFSWPSDGRQISAIPWRVNARSLDWSPDGNDLAFSNTLPDKTHAWIALLSLRDSSIRRLTSPTSQNLDYGPSFSPDGSKIAFISGIAAGVVEDIYVIPTAGGSPRRLTFDNTWIVGSPAWTSDGRDLVFSSPRGGLLSLWRVSASGGTPRPVPGVGVIAAFPTISPTGNQLAYQRADNKINIWRLNLKDQTHLQDPPAALITQNYGNSRPQFSPNGKKIVFESNRSGYDEIWACDSDGLNCAQLTSLRGTAGAARWSPDGRYIAFEYRPKGHSEIYLLDTRTGVPQLLPTLPEADNGGPSWSRDGKSIYFYSDRGGGSFQIWKTQIPEVAQIAQVESGTPVQVTTNGGVFAQESDDGQFLYYSKFESPGLWKRPTAGGDEARILDQPTGDNWWNWAVTHNGIYFFTWRKDKKSGVAFFDFASRKESLLAPIDKPSLGLALSPDGRSILYVQTEWVRSSIMLVKNFR